MRRSSWLAAVVIGTAVAACSGWPSSDVVFEEVTHQVQDCPAAESGGRDCLLVEATVTGRGRGTGSCTIFAAGDGRNIEISATSDDWDLQPGRTVRWEVVVERPDAPDFRGWNPVCDPMAEG